MSMAMASWLGMNDSSSKGALKSSKLLFKMWFVLFRSDLELVLVVVFKSVFSTSSDAEYKEMVDALLNAASFSKSTGGGDDKGMSFWRFQKLVLTRSYCQKVSRKLAYTAQSRFLLFTTILFLSYLIKIVTFLLFILLCIARPGYQVPHLLYDEDTVDSNILLLKKEYAWHIGGALPHHELQEWKLLYHSSLHGQSFNTFLGHTSWVVSSSTRLKSKNQREKLVQWITNERFLSLQETLVCLHPCWSSKTEKAVCMEDTPLSLGRGTAISTETWSLSFPALP